ncbi:hypothetical protein [Lentzea sp. CC55]|uniref:hypothetical protein n=1 Tax=Lentzea sp. CC55 TaxID=2884909 RepID=UPI001F2D14CB|nr:hypothetical protein [Lentzea sp. CC55]MCG8927239.1 hypothetical protein [Lentzea sp. CC55]
MSAEAWVPDACTLPTDGRPLRVAEFDELFATAVKRVDRPESTRLVLDLEPRPEVAGRTADPATRETGCCSFFTFGLTATGGALRLSVEVPDAHTEVLDAPARRLPS